MTALRKANVITNIIGICGTGFLSYKYIITAENTAQKSMLTDKNLPVTLPKNVQNIVNKVLDDLKLSADEKKLIKFVPIEGLELKHFGHTRIGSGSYIGIPKYFYSELEEKNYVTEFSHCKDPQILKNYLRAFSLSENAKKFGIARAVCESKDEIFSFQLFMPLFVSSVIGLFFIYFERFKNNRKLNSVFSLTVPITAAIVGLAFFDFINVFKEGCADFEAAHLGKDYSEGGVEYYEKMLERNKILKKVDEISLFDDDGEIYSFRGITHMPLTIRLKYLQDIYKSVKDNVKSPSIWSYLNINISDIKIFPDN